jgi:hypothetical protein
MMDILDEAVPKGVPPEMREEIVQQLAMEILNGDKAFAVLRQQALAIKKRLNRDYHNRLQMMSLSQPIAEDGLTLGDVLEG